MRLTEELRGKIVRGAEEAILRKRTEELRDREDRLATFVYDRIYEPVIQSKMTELPDGFFAQKSAVFVYFGSNEKTAELRMKISRLVANNDLYYQNPKWSVEDHGNTKIVGSIRKWVEDMKQLRADRTTLHQELMVVLRTCKTEKQLRERWPEGLQWYAEYLQKEPTTNLPAVTTDALNTLILRVGA